jgi:hypothetical protein
MLELSIWKVTNVLSEDIDTSSIHFTQCVGYEK